MQLALIEQRLEVVGESVGARGRPPPLAKVGDPGLRCLGRLWLIFPNSSRVRSGGSSNSNAVLKP